MQKQNKLVRIHNYFLKDSIVSTLNEFDVFYTGIIFFENMPLSKDIQCWIL